MKQVVRGRSEKVLTVRIIEVDWQWLASWMCLTLVFDTL